TPWGGSDVQVAFNPGPTPVMLAKDWNTKLIDAIHGDANAVANVVAQSDYGLLRVGLSGALTVNTKASNGNLLRYASSRITTGRVQARWQDTTVATGNGGGNRTIIFIGLLALDGNMNVNFLKPEIPAGTSYIFAAASEANLLLR